MKSEVGAEEHIVTLLVGDVPDQPNYTGKVSFAPRRVDITYRRQGNGFFHWHALGWSKITITGCRRLASGGVGTQEIGREFYRSACSAPELPDWVQALVEEHRPDGWTDGFGSPADVAGDF